MPSDPTPDLPEPIPTDPGVRGIGVQGEKRNVPQTAIRAATLGSTRKFCPSPFSGLRPHCAIVLPMVIGANPEAIPKENRAGA